MGFAGDRLWLDAAEAERDERIGEHEGYVTLFDVANNRYLGNRLDWSEAIGAFMQSARQDAGGPGWLADLLEKRLQVVPRCHCDEARYGGEEWTGERIAIQLDGVGVDFDATNRLAEAAWRGHVEALRDSLEELHAAEALRRGAHLVALDELRALDPMERHAAIRTARAALDAIEVDAVVASRRDGRTWTEIGVELGVTKQAARGRFMKYDPQGAEAA